MRSIRTKITLLTVFAIVISLIAATVCSVVMIRKLGKSDSEQMLYLLCETGEKNLDLYFEDIEDSADVVSKFAFEDLSKTSLDDLENHVNRVASIFEKIAASTHGALTYYYRLEPSISDTVNGFWYVKDKNGMFIYHDVTDLTGYDLEDTTQIKWYTVPRNQKKSIWLSPYFTENLNTLVFSYNVPIFRNNEFVGVIGIEIDYETVEEIVDSIKVFEKGYAFINDSDGNIICHPVIDVRLLTDDNKPKVPDGLLSDENYLVYKYEGVKKEAVWQELSNGMRLNVSVPVTELNGNWQQLLSIMIGASVILLIVFVLITLHMTGPITKPITELSEGALQVDKGNYDVKLEYKNNDEIGVLTNTFNNLIAHLKDYIAELSSMAYDDALTSVHNKGVFDSNVHELQELIKEKPEEVKFAIAIFDCDNLKMINDKYGHKKGDIYLKTASNFICSVFTNSSIFRIGGDEFAAIIQNEDYEKRYELRDLFIQKMEDINKVTLNKWSEVHLSIGLSEYQYEKDKLVDDVINRADKLMYHFKKNKKNLDN